MATTDTELTGLEARKAELIQRFLELQELADRTNDKIYAITVEIERLNAQIARARSAEAPRAR
jgi:predicted  nucleic acid-binding Zn-ribbon protein